MPDPWTSVASLLWSMLSNIINGYSTRRKHFFENHIEPLQLYITQIHKDYVAGFEEARLHIREDTAAPKPIFEFLRERRRDYECERELVRRLATKLEKVHRSGIRGETWEAVENYCRSIVRYFSASATITGVSWYTDYLNFAQSQINPPWVLNNPELSHGLGLSTEIWSPGGISGNPRGILLRRLDELLDKELPNAFAEVIGVYAELKARLL